MPYAYRDDLATADIAFEAWGATLESTFVAAAEATLNVMVEELDTVELEEERSIELESDAIDMLLFDTLQEIIYWKDAEGLLMRLDEPTISEENGAFRLRGTLRGEAIRRDEHETRVDVKAITMHRFALEPTDRGYKATVVLDI